MTDHTAPTLESLDARLLILESLTAWANEEPPKDASGVLQAEIRDVLLWRAKQQWPVDEDTTWEQLVEAARKPKPAPDAPHEVRVRRT